LLRSAAAGENVYFFPAIDVLGKIIF